jgi:hypothetical protein
MLSRWFRRVVRWVVALLLLPVNMGVSWAVWDVARSSVSASPFWVPLLVGLGAADIQAVNQRAIDEALAMLHRGDCV